MKSARFEKAIADVSKIYAHPNEVVADSELSRTEKIKLLRQWEVDLKENMVATEENMAAETSEGNSADLLRDVRKALATLGDEHHENAAVAKGGA